MIRHSHHGTQPWNYSPVENHHAAGATVFEPAGALNHHQYGNAPTYYNLAAEPSGGRDGRKAAAALSFWSPAASAAGGGSTGGGGTTGTTTTGAAGEYAKYSTTGSVSSAGGPSSDPAVSSSCHQSFSAAAAQSWCSYSPYSSAAAAAATRHHHHVVDTHHHPHHTQPVPYLNPTDEGRRVAAAAAMVAAESAGFTHDGYGLRNYAPEPVPSTPYPPPGKPGSPLQPCRRVKVSVTTALNGLRASLPVATSDTSLAGCHQRLSSSNSSRPSFVTAHIPPTLYVPRSYLNSD